MADPIHIICTRPLDSTLLAAAAAAGIRISTHALIETRPVIDGALTAAITPLLRKPIAAIFTSMNAVEALAGHLTLEEVKWQVYCLGETTAQLVQTHLPGSTIAGSAPHARALAAEIIRQRPNLPMVFFCGSQRLQELPALLASEGIALREVVVYETIPTPVRIDAPYDGLMFFSPSAVESFCSLQSIAPKATVFAIGPTTAATVQKHGANIIIEADAPGKGNLLHTVIAHYHTPAGETRPSASPSPIHQ